ncbi:N-acetylmuramoyl-L-alanine amidase [Candidatus Saccharibacteria bacterium]|nr:N-acetylmuramoyl-L-alanine amidase [Candidatus Saccharibacteria bacterium]
MDFDEARWSQLIKEPDWYLQFNDFITDAKQKLKPESEELNQLNKTVRHFFEAALQEEKVSLAKQGPDLDKQRQPVDTIVIHHTSARPGYRLTYLNAVHLLNIYVPYYANPTVRGEKDLKGQPMWSGHFYGGKQVFWGYHWFMGRDGKPVRLLEDQQIGWHAGDWKINRRSIGICLDNDYEQQDPDDAVLKKLAGLIRQNYPSIKSSNVIGHRESNLNTTCPGGNFIGGWKDKLLSYVEESR